MDAKARKKTVPKDNSAKNIGEKIALRRIAMAHVGEARVLDLFCGGGEMYHRVWHEAVAYVGCDQKFVPFGARQFVCDNALLVRAIDLGTSNVFDLDAYGSPWHVARLVAARRQAAPDERLAIVVTDGSEFGGRMGRMCAHLRALAGIDTPRTAGIGTLWPEVVRRAALEIARQMDARLEGLKWARHNGVFYAAILLVGISRSNTPCTPAPPLADGSGS